MKRVLLVDDDPVVLSVYRDGLSRHGYDVQTAEDGLAAIRALGGPPPDVVVLDLMMPRFSGSEVLSFIRAQPDLAQLPVIVLSNAYMDALAQDAAVKGAQKGLLKVRCTPVILASTIKEVLEGVTLGSDTSLLLAAPKDEASPQRGLQNASDTDASPVSALAAQLPSPPASEGAAGEDARSNAEARGKFLARIPMIVVELRGLYDAVREAKTEGERRLRLEALYRRLHFVAAEAGLAGCHGPALLASALEALTLQLLDRPERITPSSLRTMIRTMELLPVLSRQEKEAARPDLPNAEILVIDDDALSNRLIVSALRQLKVKATSVENPAEGLQLLQKAHYDLLLLDIHLPGMSGFEVCRQARSMPAYRNTPVIYVTSQNDFEVQAQSLEMGANDLISKPVLPMELATKVVMHLLRSSTARAPI